MFGSNTLDIAVGVVFTFLSVSLICTAINEAIAGMFRTRARNLERGVRNLLDGSSRFPITPLQKLFRPSLRKLSPAPNSWATRLLNHPLIDGLSQDNKRPSYLPSQTFATVLLHLAAEYRQPSRLEPATTVLPLSGVANFDQIRATIENIENDHIKKLLLPLLEEARSDVTVGISASRKFQSRIEIWYDHAMDRVTGWYKRRTQGMLLLISFIVVSLSNVDTVAVFRALAKDSTLRNSVVAMADQTLKANHSQAAAKPAGMAPGNAPAEQQPSNSEAAASPAAEFVDSVASIQKSVDRLDQLGIPIGWVSSETAHHFEEGDQYQRAADAAARPIADVLRQLNASQNPATIVDLKNQYRAELDAADKANAKLAAWRLAYSAPRGDVPADLFGYFFLHAPVVFWTKMAGLLLTAFAASLGAPFWFDLLNKFMSIRCTGKAPEEQPKTPKAVLQPETPLEHRGTT